MARKKQFKTITGMADIMPTDYKIWKEVEEVITAIANFYDFARISTPILEDEDLFVKGTGQSTEVIEKQMFSFRTKGKEKVVLRPEFTPSIIRAYIENGLESRQKPVKLWTLGPLFRYEKPQKGRYRQFHQFDFEIIGDAASATDALLIQLLLNILERLGLKNWRLEVNSIGCQECRPHYLKQLKKYYNERKKHLCADCKKRLEKNPLRVLDCKEEKCQRVKKTAPQIVNSLCQECYKHFHSLLEFLDAMGISYILNPYLVRGLDYYEKTVFEIMPEEENNRQGTLIGGGRYDKLIEQLGGKPTPAVGAAGGMERIIEIIKEENLHPNIQRRVFESFENPPQIFLVQLGDLAKKKILKLIEEFKKNGIKVAQNIGKDNLKSQLQLASKMKVKYSLILGQREVLEDTIIVRDMENSIQEVLPQKGIIKEIKKRIKELK